MQPSWIDFMGLLGQASIALLGFLFIGFQLVRDRWIGSRMRQLVAVQALFEFLVPAFFAMFALLPFEGQTIDGVPVAMWQIGGALLSLLGLSLTVKITQYGRDNRTTLDQFGENQLSLQKYVYGEYTLVLVGIFAGSLFWTSIVMIWLLAAGVWESWLFLPRQTS